MKYYKYEIIYILLTLISIVSLVKAYNVVGINYWVMIYILIAFGCSMIQWCMLLTSVDNIKRSYNKLFK